RRRPVAQQARRRHDLTRRAPTRGSHSFTLLGGRLRRLLSLRSRVLPQRRSAGRDLSAMNAKALVCLAAVSALFAGCAAQKASTTAPVPSSSSSAAAPAAAP